MDQNISKLLKRKKNRGEQKKHNRTERNGTEQIETKWIGTTIFKKICQILHSTVHWCSYLIHLVRNDGSQSLVHVKIKIDFARLKT